MPFDIDELWIEILPFLSPIKAEVYEIYPVVIYLCKTKE